MKVQNQNTITTQILFGKVVSVKALMSSTLTTTNTAGIQRRCNGKDHDTICARFCPEKRRIYECVDEFGKMYASSDNQ
jgi:hypothetical protein